MTLPLPSFTKPMIHLPDDTNNNLNNSAAKPAINVPNDAVSRFSADTLNSSSSNQVFDRKTIEGLDFKYLRNADLPKNVLIWGMIIPIIGWIALICLKIQYTSKHRAAEKLLNDGKIDTTEDKVKKLSTIIKMSGPLAWQYRLELARLQLLNGDFEAANQTLDESNAQRGLEETPYNVRDKGLISFKILRIPGLGFRDGENIMEFHHRTGKEAFLNAAIQAANGSLDQAYDSYNEAIYYDSSLKSKSRLSQVTLVERMKDKSTLTNLTERSFEILEKEKAFQTRWENATNW